jgi:hypothetical protein
MDEASRLFQNPKDKSMNIESNSFRKIEIFNREFNLSDDLGIPELIRLCHFLLSRIPDEGLKEVVESLINIHDFCQKSAIQPAPPLIMPTLIAEITPPYTRSEFYAEEE